MSISDFQKSFWRQMFFLKMLNMEQEYFKKFQMHGGVKHILHRITGAQNKAVEQMKTYLPNSKEQFKYVMNENEEKIMAMSNIIYKLSLLSTEDVLKIESEFEHLNLPDDTNN